MKVRIDGLPGIPTIDGIDYDAMDCALLKERIWELSGHNSPQLKDWICVGMGARDGLLHLRRSTALGNEERQVIDAHAGYGAFNFGAHPEAIVRAATSFLSERFPATVRILDHPYYAPALDALTKATGTEAGMLFLSGADAVEAAYVAVMRWRARTGRAASDGTDAAFVVSAEGCHHGTTHFARSLSSHPRMREHSGSLSSHVKHVPFGDILALQHMFESITVGMVILEPIQGIGGCVVPPSGYLKGVELLCRKHDAVFVLDEIKTGFGRTGSDFAFEADNCTPDLVLVGKPAGGAVTPVSAVLGRRDIIHAVPPGVLGTTLGATPLQCVVLLAALKELSDKDLAEAARRKGERFIASVIDLRTKYPEAELSVSGKGLLLAVRTRFNNKDFVEALLEEGVWTRPVGRNDNSFYVTPSLTIPDDLLDTIVRAIERVVIRLR